jgi:chromatin segregation and condensation protein Rec8/ScpA/Scc1 (kleisin family)
MEHEKFMLQIQLDLASEYLIMAVTLAEKELRILLPKSIDGEDDGEGSRICFFA